ncbi:MAG: hypothetical protein WAL71_05485 [Terriglobales bacterium]
MLQQRTAALPLNTPVRRVMGPVEQEQRLADRVDKGTAGRDKPAPVELGRPVQTEPGKPAAIELAKRAAIEPGKLAATELDKRAVIGPGKPVATEPDKRAATGKRAAIEVVKPLVIEAELDLISRREPGTFLLRAAAARPSGRMDRFARSTATACTSSMVSTAAARLWARTTERGW